MLRSLRRLTTTALPFTRQSATALLAEQAAAASRPALGAAAASIRAYRKLADPPIAFTVYKSRDGAPDSATCTAAGARALQARIDNAWAKNLRISVHDRGTDIAEEARDPRLGPEGVKNFENVKTALAAHFGNTARALLRGEKTIGIGGDHSMAVATIRASVLGEAVRALLDDRGFPDLRLQGPSAPALRASFEAARNAEDVPELGRLLDEALATGALDADAFNTFKQRFWVLWFDAHPDKNAPKLDAPRAGPGRAAPSPSGNFHGMPAATASGDGPLALTTHVSRNLSIPEKNFIYAGVRDADPAEEEHLRELGILSVGMDQLSGTRMVKEAVRRMLDTAERNSRAETGKSALFVVEFDVDVYDARLVPRTGTPVGTGSARNPAPGIEVKPMLAALRGIMRDPRIVSADVAEIGFHPGDAQHPTVDAGQRTIAAMLDLTAEQARGLFGAQR